MLGNSKLIFVVSILRNLHIKIRNEKFLAAFFEEVSFTFSIFRMPDETNNVSSNKIDSSRIIKNCQSKQQP